MNRGAVHTLKINPTDYFDVSVGAKSFELRKNDRNYKVNDVLRLREWQRDGGVECGGYYSGRNPLWRRVEYMLHGGAFGLQAGYVIMGVVVYRPTIKDKEEFGK